LVFDEKYNWLFVNVGTQRIYKKFDEIVLNEDDEKTKVEIIDEKK
jgi:hypothetical protein